LLTLHSSNRLEDLAALLADRLRASQAHPLQPNRVAVPSNGMARWLSLRLADTNGITANLDFPLPGTLIWQVFQAVFPDHQSLDTSAFSTGAMTWQLFDYFQRGESIEAGIDHYLAGADVVGRFELAHRLADVFDQYLIYRPDWIQQWEAGEDDHWQASLWRRLVADLGGGPHRGHLLDAFREQLPWDSSGALPPQLEGLASRLHVFGLSSIPPAYLDVLGRLSQVIPVDIYRLAPTREYGGDLVAPATLTARALAGSADAPYLETGHPLLASWGRQGAELENLLQELAPDPVEEFTDPGTETVLGALQSDILNLRDRTATEGPDRLSPPDPADPEANLAFEVCHSPMREVEVLYDKLLALFAVHPDLRPSDVLVMTPDIDTYAPYIEAVFGNPGDRPALPYKIADQGPRTRSALVEAAFRLLELPASRFGVNEVLDLLALSPVRERLGLAEAERERLRSWVQDTRIRWGIDGEFRAEQGLPAEDSHTWKAGLDRQLLGYALPGDGQQLFDGILPYPEAEGGWAVTLGRFQAFTRDLFRWRTTLQADHAPQQWAAHLQAYLERFLDPATPEQADELAGLHRGLAQTAQLAEKAGFDGPIPRDIMVRELENQLSLSTEGRSFLGHGVTFCAMTPMRAIPREVVYLIGMNDGSFPRVQRPQAFDRMATDYRPGDRARREDDRYLFLETLLSARRHLGISYVGADIRSNASRPPSVLVSELADAVDGTFAPPADQPPYSEQLTTAHPLHAFSPRYFTGKEAGLYSYSAALREAAERLVQPSPSETETGFFPDPLPEADETWRTLEFSEVIDFFRHPAKFLLQRRLGVRLEVGEEELETREPFQLNGLENHELRQQIFSLWRSGQPTPAAEPVARAAGLLPHGEAGDAVFTEARQQVDQFTERLAPFWAQPPLDPVPVRLALATITLTGWLGEMRQDGQLVYRFGKVNPNMAIEGVLRHLALCAAAPTEVPHRTHLVALDATVRLDPVPAEAAREALATLGDALWSGLHRPLPFLPRAGFTYAKEQAKKDDPDRALKEAAKQWPPDDYRPMPGESEDPYNALAFREGNPIEADPDTFTGIADQLLLPVAEQLND